jgi:hypothetical protein
MQLPPFMTVRRGRGSRAKALRTSMREARTSLDYSDIRRASATPGSGAVILRAAMIPCFFGAPAAPCFPARTFSMQHFAEQSGSHPLRSAPRGGVCTRPLGARVVFPYCRLGSAPRGHGLGAPLPRRLRGFAQTWRLGRSGRARAAL